MKVRVRQDPDGTSWNVEKKEWFFFVPLWDHLTMFRGDNARDEAVRYAQRMKGESKKKKKTRTAWLKRLHLQL